MNDPRIRALSRVARRMAEGDFHVSVPSGTADEVDELGRAVADLGRATENRLSELRALLSVTARINSGLVLEDVLGNIYESFAPILPYDRIGCALVDPSGRLVRAVWARTTAPVAGIAAGYTAALQRSSLARILETGEPRILNDLEAYLREHPESDSTRRIVQEGVRSSLTCPLVTDGRPVGFLFFSSRQPGTYASAHVDLYTQIASQVSVAVEKSRLYQELLETRRLLLEANQTLADAASFDGLTGIANRRQFDKVFEREWMRARRLSEPISVILVDIDYFKQFNDQNGHLAGDDCLRRVAGALASQAKRGTDLVARYGGEEFAVLLGQTALSDAVRFADRLRAKVEDLAIAHPGSQVSPHVTISLGVVSGVPRRDDAPLSLLGAADTALYEAKHAGRNQVAATEWAGR